MSTNWSEKATILLEKLVRKRYYFGDRWYYMTFGNTGKDVKFPAQNYKNHSGSCTIGVTRPLTIQD